MSIAVGEMMQLIVIVSVLESHPLGRSWLPIGLPELVSLSEFEAFAQRSQQKGDTLLNALLVALGTGELPNAVRHRLAPYGIRLNILLLDKARTHLNGARDAVVADALPFREQAVDLVSSSLFLHHLEPVETVRFINEALRVCRLAVLINDLRRTELHLAAAYAGSLLFRSRLTRHDAPASVRRAYTVAELHAALKQTQAAQVDITTYFLFRMGVIVWK